MSSNGQSEVSTEGMTTDDKLDLIVEAVKDLSGQVSELVDQQNELIEKLTNMSLPGGDFDTDEFDS